MDKKIVMKDIINEILKDKGKKPIDTMKEHSSLRRDIGFDSMDMAVLTVRLEEKYGIDIFENGIVDTVGDIIRELDRK